MLVMNERGADKLLSSKFTLGAEGSVAAGPVGRTATAQTDAQMHADILSWSRTQGLFAGVALEGATLRQDLDDNANIYGQRLENRAIVSSRRRMPPAAAKLVAVLNRYSPREEKRATGLTSYEKITSRIPDDVRNVCPHRLPPRNGTKMPTAPRRGSRPSTASP